MATKVQGDYEDFKKAVDKINPDPATHYNKKSLESDTQEKTALLNETDSNKQEKLNREAIQALIIGCRLAQEKGVYTLEEARTIMHAIDALTS